MEKIELKEKDVIQLILLIMPKKGRVNDRKRI